MRENLRKQEIPSVPGQRIERTVSHCPGQNGQRAQQDRCAVALDRKRSHAPLGLSVMKPKRSFDPELDTTAGLPNRPAMGFVDNTTQCKSWARIKAHLLAVAGSSLLNGSGGDSVGGR